MKSMVYCTVCTCVTKRNAVRAPPADPICVATPHLNRAPESRHNPAMAT